jgi:hypothetical protein
MLNCSGDSFPMKLRDKWEPHRYEQRLQALRWERKTEAKQAERLCAVLAKKMCANKSAAVAVRVV